MSHHDCEFRLEIVTEHVTVGVLVLGGVGVLVDMSHHYCESHLEIVAEHVKVGVLLWVMFSEFLGT